LRRKQGCHCCTPRLSPLHVNNFRQHNASFGLFLCHGNLINPCDGHQYIIDSQFSSSNFLLNDVWTLNLLGNTASAPSSVAQISLKRCLNSESTGRLLEAESYIIRNRIQLLCSNERAKRSCRNLDYQKQDPVPMLQREG
jgi:hypothetical protein